MKIILKENNKPNMPKCEMLCDNGLSEHLNNYELTKFLNNHSVNLFIGRPASGKTSLLYSFFKGGKKDNRLLKKVYHNIYLFQPSHSRKSMKDNIFEEKLRDENKYDELTYENLEEVINKIKSAEPDERNCIILDDMGAYLKNKDTQKLFRELLMNRRHLHTSIFFLVQTFFSVPKDLRRLFTNTFVFRTTKNEMENIFNELVETKKEYMLDIMKYVYDKPYQWLFLNSDSGRLFKMWDEILINDVDDVDDIDEMSDKDEC